MDTVVAVISEAINNRTSHLEPLNLAFGQRITLLEVISELEVILGRELSIDFQPSRVGDVSRSQADSTGIRRLFPNVEPSDFTGGLRATVDWFQSMRPWHRGDN
ncbi:MAG: hypothetical protein CL471_15045 [Acidobacteria bacterium]|nr:hypothetical protein [Acidobacteriota bacterium]